MSVNNDGLAAQLLVEYFDRKTLAELGVRTEASDLTDWEVEAFTLIHNQIAKTMNEESNRKQRRKGLR